MNTPATLLDFISHVFDLDEIKTIVFQLDVDFENLAGETKEAKVRELIKLMRRKNGDGLNQLVNIVAAKRPEQFAAHFPEHSSQLEQTIANTSTHPPILLPAASKLETIHIGNSPITALEWMTNDLILAFCADSRELLVVSTITGQVIERHKRAFSPVGLYYNPKRMLLVTWSNDYLLIESFKNGSLKHVWEQWYPRLNDVAVSQEASLLAQVGGTIDGLGRLIKLSDFSVKVVYSPKPLLQAAISLKENLLAAVSSDQQVLVWDTVTRRLVRHHNHVGEILSLLFTSDGSATSIILSDGRMLIQRVSDSVVIASKAIFSPNYAETPVLHRLFNNVLATVGSSTYIWSSDNGNLLYSFPSEGKILCARDSSDGIYQVAVGTQEGSLIIPKLSLAVC